MTEENTLLVTEAFTKSTKISQVRALIDLEISKRSITLFTEAKKLFRFYVVSYKTCS